MKKDEEAYQMIAELSLLKKDELKFTPLEGLVHEHFRKPEKEISERNLENIMKLYYKFFRSNNFMLPARSEKDVYRKGGRRSVA